MEKEFLPYELSLRLKQLGFDEPCFGYYDMGQKFNFPGSTMNNRNFINLKTTMAPLFQQAFRWFREKYNLYTGIYKMYDVVNGSIILSENRYDQRQDKQVEYHVPKHFGHTYKSWEEAELACLEKLIEIVEQNESGRESN